VLEFREAFFSAGALVLAPHAEVRLGLNRHFDAIGMMKPAWST
jgi:hypothetical protein